MLLPAGTAQTDGRFFPVAHGTTGAQVLLAAQREHQARHDQGAAAPARRRVPLSGLAAGKSKGNVNSASQKWSIQPASPVKYLVQSSARAA